MPKKKSSSLNCGASYTIPKGYHNGSGIIKANSLSSQTSATAVAADIVSGKTAWVNGRKITGTLVRTKSVNLTMYSGTITINSSFSNRRIINGYDISSTYDDSDIYAFVFRVDYTSGTNKTDRYIIAGKKSYTISAMMGSGVTIPTIASAYSTTSDVTASNSASWYIKLYRMSTPRFYATIYKYDVEGSGGSVTLKIILEKIII